MYGLKPVPFREERLGWVCGLPPMPQKRGMDGAPGWLWRGWGVAFPGLRSETWGTQFPVSGDGATATADLSTRCARSRRQESFVWGVLVVLGYGHAGCASTKQKGRPKRDGLSVLRTKAGGGISLRRRARLAGWASQGRCCRARRCLRRAFRRERARGRAWPCGRFRRPA